MRSASFLGRRAVAASSRRGLWPWQLSLRSDGVIPSISNNTKDYAAQAAHFPASGQLACRASSSSSALNGADQSRDANRASEDDSGTNNIPQDALASASESSGHSGIQSSDALSRSSTAAPQTSAESDDETAVTDYVSASRAAVLGRSVRKEELQNVRNNIPIQRLPLYQPVCVFDLWE